MPVRIFLTQNSMLTSKYNKKIFTNIISSSLIDVNYNVPLADLEGFLDKPPLQKFFAANCFSFEDFLQIYLHGKIHQLLGLMEYPIRSTKKCPKINKFLFKVSLSCMNNDIIPV